MNSNFMEIAQELGRLSLKAGGEVNQHLIVSSSALFSGDVHFGSNTYVGGLLTISSATTLTADMTATSSITANAFKLSCPTGFTELTAAGRTFGCLQTDEEGSGTWAAAMDDCFDTYGGSLPPIRALCIGFQNYTFTNEDDDNEWAGEANNSADAIIQQGASGDCNPGVAALGGSVAYRCWIPR